jgi:hypothetical protein
MKLALKLWRSFTIFVTKVEKKVNQHKHPIMPIQNLWLPFGIAITVGGYF